MRIFISIIFFLTTICFTFVIGEQKVKCYYIFGDDRPDAGNNNNLITRAKANYPPYGVDFPGQIPTGRFTNGRTTVDFISQALGYNSLIKPSSSRNITNQDILKGLNFASGAAGILDESGIELGQRFSLNRQLINYGLIIPKLQLLVEGPVAKYLNKCLFTVNIGANDYITNYFLPQNNITRILFTPNQFAEKLVAQYRTQLQALYNTGARKIAIFGVGRIGCSIGLKLKFNSTECVEEINDAVIQFNNKLVSVIDALNANLEGADFTFFNITAIQNSNVIPAGFITNSSCCQLGRDFLCEPNTPPCANRNNYLFFDGFHRTEIVNQRFANMLFNTVNSSFVRPKNINQLIQS